MLRPFPPDAKAGPRRWRAQVSHRLERTSTHFAGALADVILLAEERLAQGYEITAGDMPDRSLMCERCDGTGREPTDQEDQ